MLLNLCKKLFLCKKYQKYTSPSKRDSVVWMNQQQMGELYQTAKSTLSEHIKNILQEGELVENSVVRNFRTTASEGKNYNVTYYALPMVLAVGFRVRSIRGNRIKNA